MSKQCPQCGVKYKNSATKCVICNTEFFSNHPRKKSKHFAIIACIGVLVISAIIAAVLVLSSPKTMVRHIMNSYKRNDAEAVIKTFPDFFMESDQFDIDAYVMDIEYNVQDMSDYIFSFNVEKAESPSSKEREEFLDSFRYYGAENFHEDDLDDIRVVWVNYKGNVPGVWPSRAARFVMIKYDGKWYWWPETVNR